MSKINPSIKSFLIFLLPSLIIWLLVFNIQTFSFFIWMLMLQFCFYFLTGAVAGRFYYMPLRRRFPQGKATEAMRAGGTAGIWLSSFVLVFFVTMILISPEKPYYLSQMFLSVIGVFFFGIVNFFCGLFIAAAGGRALYK